ncbi:MAG: NADH-quinone oxidoreductase subunit C [Planctomycetota bacterium]|nr:NADH-quinone oxidoreductase subunit C [Planctomycetota bacterium]
MTTTQTPPVIPATHEPLLAVARSVAGEDGVTVSVFRDNVRFHVVPGKVLAVLKNLRSECGLDMLIDLSAADYLNYPGAANRYGIWYVLESVSSGLRVIVKTWANDPEPRLDSVFDVWRGADWMEREVFDMFGVVFDGHPDLRRILMPDEFVAHPMRKDYPLRGEGERHNFLALSREQS